MYALAPPALMWSITLWPSSPLEFASPLGNSAVDEFSRIRVDSNDDAQRKMTLARNSIAARLCASITRTPLARRDFESKFKLWTTLNGRRVILPVFSATGSVAFRLLKYERVMQPLSHGPQ